MESTEQGSGLARYKRTIQVGCAAAAAVPSLVVLVVAAVVIVGELRATDWPSVTGRILEVRTVSGAQPHRDSEPEFRYEYEVDGTRYEGSDVGYVTDDPMENIRMMRDIGGEIPVFYDPTDPAESCLEVEVDWLLPLGLTVGALVLAASLVPVAWLIGTALGNDRQRDR